MVVKVANIQHLAAPIRAQLAAPLDALDAGWDPASDAGRRSRAALGGRGDPGAGGVRPRLVRRDARAGPTRPATASSASRFAARCSAVGSPAVSPAVGIVGDSDPASELAETEIKLQVMLPVLTG